MQFNPHTNELFTDDGYLIKKLHCPVSKQWDVLIQTDFLKGKMCGGCQRMVLDTSLYNDEELQQQLKLNSHTCLKVDLNQNNLTITYKHHENE